MYFNWWEIWLKIISSYFSQILIWKMIYKLMKQTQLQVYISVTKRKWDNYVHSLVCNFSYNLGFVLVWSTLLLYYKCTLYKCAYIQIHNVQYKLGLAFFFFFFFGKWGGIVFSLLVKNECLWFSADISLIKSQVRQSQETFIENKNHTSNFWLHISYYGWRHWNRDDFFQLFFRWKRNSKNCRSQSEQVKNDLFWKGV